MAGFVALLDDEVSCSDISGLAKDDKIGVLLMMCMSLLSSLLSNGTD